MADFDGKEIARLRRICDSARPALWPIEIHEDQTGEREPWVRCDFSDEDNQVFISEALTALPAALDEVERLRSEFAVYGYHNPNCPRNQDHACTCGLSEVRQRIWGSIERPAQEPRYSRHPDQDGPLRLGARLAKAREELSALRAEREGHQIAFMKLADEIEELRDTVKRQRDTIDALLAKRGSGAANA